MKKIRVRRKIGKLNVLDKSISVPQEESNFKVNDKIKKNDYRWEDNYW